MMRKIKNFHNDNEDLKRVIIVSVTTTLITRLLLALLQCWLRL